MAGNQVERFGNAGKEGNQGLSNRRFPDPAQPQGGKRYPYLAGRQIEVEIISCPPNCSRQTIAPLHHAGEPAIIGAYESEFRGNEEAVGAHQ